MDQTNSKAEFQIPVSERRDVAPSVNDAQLAEARRVVDALAFRQASRSPELMNSPEATEILAIGNEIQSMREQYIGRRAA